MVSTTTFIQDTIVFLRNDLRTNITDPISTSRAANSQFVITSYPQRKVVYPLITVRYQGGATLQRLGMRSELEATSIPVEIRIWSRNEIEKDTLTQQVVNQLRSNQFGGSTSSSDNENIHDYKITSMIPIDEDVGNQASGRQTIKSMIINVDYLFILGS